MEEEDSPGEEDSQKIDVCSSRREERSAESDVRFSLGYQIQSDVKIELGRHLFSSEGGEVCRN